MYTNEAGQFFASINYEETNLPNPKNNEKSIALDVGVKVFAFTSQNQMIVQKKEHLLEKNIRKMIKAQKSGLNRSILNNLGEDSLSF